MTSASTETLSTLLSQALQLCSCNLSTFNLISFHICVTEVVQYYLRSFNRELLRKHAPRPVLPRYRYVPILRAIGSLHHLAGYSKLADSLSLKSCSQVIRSLYSPESLDPCSDNRSSPYKSEATHPQFARHQQVDVTSQFGS